LAVIDAVLSRPERDRLTATPPVTRLRSLDALRGLAVVGMLVVDNRGSSSMPAQFVHASWNGLRVADIVFPLFLFAVGMSMEHSSRTASSRPVLFRALNLAFLGMALVAVRSHHIALSFGVLQHIAAAYVLCWLLLRLPRRSQVPVAIGTLGLLCAAYAFAPAPSVVHGYQSGTNLGEWFVVHVLHVPFSAESPQSYVGSAISVFLGVLAMRAFRAGRGPVALLSATCIGAGIVLLPFVPLNKRLWTPSFTLVTSGLAAAVFLVLHVVVDGKRLELGALTRLGRNALIVFAFSEIAFRTVLAGAQPRVVGGIATITGPAGAAVAYALLSVVAAWCLCLGLDRRKRPAQRGFAFTPMRADPARGASG
jgi:predicted acyltransferase